MNRPKKVKDIIRHLNDVSYPVTGRRFTEACNNMIHLSEEERRWVENNINIDKTYNSPEEIRKDLSLIEI